MNAGEVGVPVELAAVCCRKSDRLAVPPSAPRGASAAPSSVPVWLPAVSPLPCCSYRMRIFPLSQCVSVVLLQTQE